MTPSKNNRVTLHSIRQPSGVQRDGVGLGWAGLGAVGWGGGNNNSLYQQHRSNNNGLLNTPALVSVTCIGQTEEKKHNVVCVLIDAVKTFSSRESLTLVMPFSFQHCVGLDPNSLSLTDKQFPPFCICLGV